MSNGWVGGGRGGNRERIRIYMYACYMSAIFRRIWLGGQDQVDFFLQLFILFFYSDSF